MSIPETAGVCFLKEKRCDFKAFRSFQLLMRKKQCKDAVCLTGALWLGLLRTSLDVGQWHSPPSGAISQKGLLF